MQINNPARASRLPRARMATEFRNNPPAPPNKHSKNANLMVPLLRNPPQPKQNRGLRQRPIPKLPTPVMRIARNLAQLAKMPIDLFIYRDELNPIRRSKATAQRKTLLARPNPNVTVRNGHAQYQNDEHIENVLFKGKHTPLAGFANANYMENTIKHHPFKQRSTSAYNITAVVSSQQKALKSDAVVKANC